MVTRDMLDGNCLNRLLAGLAETRPVFHSEADFQFALAWRLREETGQEVRLEYLATPGERMYLDIWLPETNVAIELKYWTRKLNVEVSREKFALKDQAAQDLGRYDFLKDIRRIEKTGRGFAVALTNDRTYWNQARKEDTVDAAFRLHEGRHLPAATPLWWSPKASEGTRKGRNEPICLCDSYCLKWRDYGPPLPEADKCNQFRYLAVEIGRQPVNRSPNQSASGVQRSR